MNTPRVVIAANFTIEPIFNSLRSVLDKTKTTHEIIFAPYNQIFQQLLDPSSLFRENESGVNVIFLRLEDLIESRQIDFVFGKAEIEQIRSNALDLGNSLQIAENFKTPLFVFICPLSKKIQSESNLLSEFNKIRNSLKQSVANNPNIHFFQTEHLESRYQLETQDDLKSNQLGHIPFTPEFFTALANETARQLDLHQRKPFKVLVLDCDNTIWDGVVGEDGVTGIGFSENRLFLQNFAVEQSRKGTLICLCSKNNEPDVWEAFNNRGEMPLRKEYIVASRINWEPKSRNLKSLAEELQLGLDSFIFVDDDAVVCSEVQLNCPEVFTILLPPKTENFAKYFEHLWVFDKLKITKEDLERTASYQRQAVRNKLQSEAGDMAEFLKSLQLVCHISEITTEQIPRVSQLSLRTNQFNSTTIRRSETDIRQLSEDENKHIWTVNVTDRFGDYGLVGVIIFDEQDEGLNVDSFMMSCRVLGRGVEHKILNELGKTALRSQLHFVNIEFAATEKNAPFQNFLAEIGENFKQDNNGKIHYQIPAQIAAEFLPKKNEPQKASDKPKDTRQEKTTSSGIDSNKYQVYLDLADLLSKKLPIAPPEKSALLREHLQNEYCAPRTETENILTEIWERILGINKIGVTDDFFKIGGDSLRGVSLFVEIEEKIGKNLPLSVLISSPTIEKLAQSIDGQGNSGDWKYLVPIQTEGTKTPLFCMHAAGGNVLFYRDLATELGTDQPLYGLQARGISDKNETAHDSVEEMAREYLQEIRQLQAQGPYQLCGSSFGGLVAFEVARQLKKVGETVSVLALFDTYAPGYLESNAVKTKSVTPFSNLISKIQNVRSQLNKIGSMREQISFIFNRLGKINTRLKRKVLWKKNEFAMQYSKATGKELPTDIQRNHKAIQKALKDYQPQSYDGKMILFRASDQPENVVFDTFLGWKKFVNQEIETEDVKGTHGALTVYPFASELAVKFNPYLNKIERKIQKTSATAASA